jgi:Ca-activated chloride channel family protein
MIRFAYPGSLLALALAVLPPVAAAWRRRRGRFPRLIFPDGRPLAGAPRTIASRLAAGRPWIRAFVLALLALALARPQAGHREEEVVSEGIDIVVALDISGSMRAQDFKPRDRLTVAKEVVEQFVQNRRADRIALVTFARLSATRCPLTLDTPVLRSVLRSVVFAPSEEDGTAIGLGLATSLSRLQSARGKSRVVVLLTDGINNAGAVDPVTAADLAVSLGVRVHTIGVGTDGPVTLALPDGRTVRTRLPLDEEVLRDVARRTGGDYFRATDKNSLERVFERIDRMETTKVELRTYARYADLFVPLLVAGAVLLAADALAGAVRLGVLP